ncbi:PAS domain S-box protein [Natronolimnohabitans innermongolicus]|nr:PAS domain S-box protein [Natronolimnohabitans innermongolicus]
MVAAGGSGSRPPPSVLYLDPNATVRRRTADSLESAVDDLTVEAVGTPTDLRRALSDPHSAYACLITEYRLSETDALSLYTSLRSDDIADVPAVLYTADGDELLASNALTAGFSGYVPKGRDDSLERLRAQLRTVVETESRADRLERYRTLVETVGDSMYILDDDGRIEMANEAMARAVGVPQSELVGKSITEFVLPADTNRVLQTLREIHATDGRAWETVEVTATLGEGPLCSVEVNVAPLVDEGTVTGSVGVVRDISSHAEQERRIRRLHDGTRRLMGATEAETIARIVTDIAADALDLELTAVHLYRDDIVTRSATASEPPPSESGSSAESREPSTRGLVPAAMSTACIDLFDGVAPRIEPGGSIAWDAYETGETVVHDDVRAAPNVRNPETPIRSEAVIPLGEHGIFIVRSLEPDDLDQETVTLAQILAANAEASLDRAQREAELAERRQELERQNERLDSFASTVSHDLRNPLTLAMGRAEMLDHQLGDDGAASAHLEEIDWAHDRMDELIENVLTLARSGKQLTETETVDLAASVDRAHRTVDSTLTVETATSLPAVDADPERLRVLFENVLRNAREHAGDGVTVTVEPTPGGFAISDDGPGIPAHARDAALEWGYSTNADGTGFGLAIVAEIVEAHGWSLSLEESADGGLRLVVSVV